MRGVRSWVAMGAAFAALSASGTRLAHAEAGASERTGEHSAPAHSLFTGAHLGVFAPYGGLYSARNLVTTEFQEVASPGPVIELDVGARIAHRYAVYGYWQYASLGRGTDTYWSETRGGQTRANTNAAGLAALWTSNPGGFGVVLDVGVGYRWFSARWNDGTAMQLGGFGDLHLDVGIDLALSSTVALSPTVTFGTGVFTDRTYGGQPVGQFNSSYTTVAVGVGVHFDFFGG